MRRSLKTSDCRYADGSVTCRNERSHTTNDEYELRGTELVRAHK